MQDLSHLADGSLTVTSQAGGNMMSGRNKAMSAPGSQPVDPLPPAKEQGDPVLDEPSKQTRPGDDGKPRAKAGDYRPPAPAWKNTH